MKLVDVLNTLHLSQACDSLQPHWDDSVATLPSNIFFLVPTEVAEYRDYCCLEQEHEEQLMATAALVRDNPALSALIWHCYRLLYIHTDYNGMTSWPHLEDALGNLSGAFYLLIAMAMVPEVKAIHKSMGVASDITRDTCRQVSSFASNYFRATSGRVGIPLKQLYWLRHYTAGRLFRIGRMEYMLRPFGGGAIVYRHKQSGKALALAPDGVRFDANGYVIIPGDSFDEKGWIATISQTSDTICGYPISPEGYALSKQAYLPLADWEQVLGKGDLALEMHIPSGGGMTPERCADSIRRAVAFFQHFFPTQTFQAVTCSSWILNTQLRQINLSSTNLADFQRELYLFPVRSSGQDGLWFIFLQDSFDLASAPRVTSLQRSVADFLATGVRWRGGGMFFLIEHLDFFGSQYYHRTGLPPTARE